MSKCVLLAAVVALLAMHVGLCVAEVGRGLALPVAVCACELQKPL